MKQKEKLTLAYQTLLCQQIFGNLDRGFLVLAANYLGIGCGLIYAAHNFLCNCNSATLQVLQ